MVIQNRLLVTLTETAAVDALTPLASLSADIPVDSCHNAREKITSNTFIWRLFSVTQQERIVLQGCFIFQKYFDGSKTSRTTTHFPQTQFGLNVHIFLE